MLVHAYGAAFDNPYLIVACVVGDGERETGPLAASWHSNKFLNPVRDGAVLPFLHLNGYKIANPTVLGRMRDEEIRDLFVGYGHEPLFVEGTIRNRCTADGRRDRCRARKHPLDPAECARGTHEFSSPEVARHLVAQSKRLDRPERSGWPEGKAFGAHTRCRLQIHAAIPIT